MLKVRLQLLLWLLLDAGALNMLGTKSKMLTEHVEKMFPIDCLLNKHKIIQLQTSNHVVYNVKTAYN